MPIYKDNKGNYLIRAYVIKFGKKVQITRRGFSTRKEASHVLSLLEGGSYNDEIESLTFNNLYRNYLKGYELKNKGQSCRRIKSYFENHILPYFGDAKVIKITIEDYMNWKQLILDKKLSDSYNKGLHGVIVTILSYAMKNFGLTNNVAKSVGGFKKTYNGKKKEVWTYEEYKKFISVIDDIVDKALFSTLYETGMRYGELAALNWNDFDGNSININKTISKEYGDNHDFMVTSPKTRSSNRIIGLSNNIIELLEQLKEHYIKYYGFNNEWYIFGGIKPYSHTTATTHKRKYCEMSKEKCITLHEFRHSHASLLLNKGVPITDISERLGHADPSVTLGIYSHMLKKEKDPIAGLLNDLNSK